jgi:pheromone shutdown protein TraB
MTYLRNNRNGAQLYLVGTAHVSEKSAEEVREVRFVIPSSLSCPT